MNTPTIRAAIAADRDAWLSGVAAEGVDDPLVRAEVASLLDHHAQAGIGGGQTE